MTNIVEKSFCMQKKKGNMSTKNIVVVVVGRKSYFLLLPHVCVSHNHMQRQCSTHNTFVGCFCAWLCLCAYVCSKGKLCHFAYPMCNVYNNRYKKTSTTSRKCWCILYVQHKMQRCKAKHYSYSASF